MRCLLSFCLAALPSLAAADGYGFMTPSGNIYCNGSLGASPYGRSDITCVIVERSSPPAMPRPASCGAAWGHAFTLFHTGPGRMECSGFPSRVNYTDIAPYGVTGQFGDITCQSESTGLTCRNPEGHGFFLSRGVQRVF